MFAVIKILVFPALKTKFELNIFHCWFSHLLPIIYQTFSQGGQEVTQR